MHMSDQVQKVLLAVGAGLALILSIIALVVALNAGGGHGDNHDGGRMFGGAQQGQMGGGPGEHRQGGPGQGGPPQGMMAPGAGQAAPNADSPTTTTK